MFKKTLFAIAISIVLFSAKFQNRYNRRNVQAKVDLADHIQEGLEAFQDIRANDAEEKYLKDLWPRIDLVEKRAVQAELGAAVSLGIQCERMDEILCHDEQRGAETLTNKGYDVEFKDVHFAYDTSETVLSGVTFTARQGEVTALIGPSGSGKTTISRLVKDKTVIIIAHRMRTVAGADKIVVLKEGKVDECGSPLELTDSGGFYKRMQDLQRNALEWNI